MPQPPDSLLLCLQCGARLTDSPEFVERHFNDVSHDIKATVAQYAWTGRLYHEQ